MTSRGSCLFAALLALSALVGVARADERPVRVIVQDEHGRPIEGAEVRWCEPPRLVHAGARKIMPEIAEYARATATDARGATAFSAPAGRRLAVVVKAARYVRSVGYVDAQSARTELTFALSRGRPLEGRVRDARGRPMAGARVRVGDFGPFFDGLEEEAHTDADGRYRFDALAAGVVSLNAAPAGVRSTRIEPVLLPDVQRYDVVIPPTFVVRGVVREVDTGKAVAGAGVRIEMLGVRTESLEAEVTTDRNGVYEVPTWPAWFVDRVRISRDGWIETWETQVDDRTSIPGNGVLERTHVLRPIDARDEAERDEQRQRSTGPVRKETPLRDGLPRVEIRVRDRAGRPISGARAAAWSTGGLRRLAREYDRGELQVRTDAHGRASVPLLDRDDRVQARARGFGATTVRLDPDRAVEVGVVEVVLDPEAVVRGNVTDAATGKPLDCVRVSARRLSWIGNSCGSGQRIGPTTLATSRADGSFVLSGLPGERIELRFELPGQRPVERRFKLRPGQTIDAEIALHRSPTLPR